VELSAFLSLLQLTRLLFYVAIPRFPVYAALAARSSRSVLDLRVHSAGSVLTAFTAADAGNKQAQRLVSIGRNDGSLMVWDIEG
jgi:hypothetical protein